MDSRRCTACGKCVAGCPGKAIGLVGLMWHKHVAFTNADACIGCNKCIKNCPDGVFCKVDERESHIRKSVISFRLERLQPLAFVATAVTGIWLHAAGHGACHGGCHNLRIAHVAASLLWLIALAFHLGRHFDWFRITSSAFSRVVVKRRITVVAMSVLFIFTLITGGVLLSVHGPASNIGLWHYKSGNLLIIAVIIHLFRRKNRGATKLSPQKK